MFSVFAAGARGGNGSRTRGGYGDLVGAIFRWKQHRTLYIVVGQNGQDACPDNMSDTVGKEGKGRHRKFPIQNFTFIGSWSMHSAN